MRACIINAAVGAWYPKGQDRLVKSLMDQGYSYDILTWKEWPNDNYSRDCIYHLKLAAFEEAIKAGYDIVFWLDSSVWAIKNPDELIDLIEREGYYIGRSGFNAAQTCSDKMLEYFGIDRDQAEKYHDCSAGMIGLDFRNETAKEFFKRWVDSAKAGTFIGSRLHDGQSSDPRFLFHRQDQAAGSIIIGQLGMKMYCFGDYIMYDDGTPINENIVLLLRGM